MLPTVQPQAKDLWSVVLVGKAEQDKVQGDLVRIHVPYVFWQLVYDSLDKALEVAVPFIKDRFKDYQSDGIVGIQKIAADEWGLFHSVYKPLGLSEIPLAIIRRHDVGDELIGVDKYFYVNADRIQPVSPR